MQENAEALRRCDELVAFVESQKDLFGKSRFDALLGGEEYAAANFSGGADAYDDVLRCMRRLGLVPGSPEKQQGPSREWLLKAAEAEDACGGMVSVGGLAVDAGMYAGEFITNELSHRVPLDGYCFMGLNFTPEQFSAINCVIVDHMADKSIEFGVEEALVEIINKVGIGGTCQECGDGVVTKEPLDIVICDNCRKNPPDIA